MCKNSRGLISERGVLTAQADGFNTGQAYISVQDVDQPDLRVINVSAPTAALSGQTVNLNYTLFNQGSQPAAGA